MAAALAAQDRLLLRSHLAVVEVASQGAAVPLEVDGLGEGGVRVTLAATRPFNTSTGAFERKDACGTDGAALSIDCPLGPELHTCDFATHGGGGPYHFDLTCPRVVPTCLFWDPRARAFLQEGCRVEPGYSPGLVTCACSHLTTFALSGNVTQAKYVVVATLRPTQSPSPVPTAAPSHGPTPLPTLRPTAVPVPRPTRAPTPLPTREPTALPTPRPTVKPTPAPSPAPSSPTPVPAPQPTRLPVPNPTAGPLGGPINVRVTLTLSAASAADVTLDTMRPALEAVLGPLGASLRGFTADFAARRYQ